MIASLRGQVLTNSGGNIVLEVGGVGYLVSVTSSADSFFAVGNEIFIYTAMIVREDAHLLFGFETADELQVFDLLRSVTGVGPKSALAVLASMSLAEIASAVVTENDAAFKKVSGIGPKTAKLITVSLAGKIGGPGQVLVGGAGSNGATANSQDSALADKAIAEATAAVIEALLGLGYAERVVVPVVSEIARELRSTNRNELLRASLSRLGTAKAVSGGEDK